VTGGFLFLAYTTFAPEILRWTYVMSLSCCKIERLVAKSYQA